jgi:hypothetical protein
MNWGPPAKKPPSRWTADDRDRGATRRQRVRLTRKLAPALNGLDLSSLTVGEVVELSERDARMLIAEGWAEPAD